MHDYDTPRGLAAATVPHLGDGWRLDTDRPADYGDALLRHADGRAVRLETARRAGRVIALGLMPRDADGPHPYITMRLDRGPEVLAREITRRLLPVYDLSYARAQQYLQDLAASRAAREVLVHRATAIPGTQRQPDARPGSTRHSSTVDWFTDAGRGTIRFDGDGSTADLTLRRIPGHLAVDLLARLTAVTSF